MKKICSELLQLPYIHNIYIYIYIYNYTVTIVSKFTSFYRFIVLNLTFYRCRRPNQSFFFLSFYRFIVLSLYGCKENIEFFCRLIVLSFQRFIVSFYRFIVEDVNLETVLIVYVYTILYDYTHICIVTYS